MIVCPVCQKDMEYYATYPANDGAGKCEICKIASYFVNNTSSDKVYYFDNKPYSEDEIVRVFKLKVFL
jgi:hypothetical protein